MPSEIIIRNSYGSHRLQLWWNACWRMWKYTHSVYYCRVWNLPKYYCNGDQVLEFETFRTFIYYNIFIRTSLCPFCHQLPKTMRSHCLHVCIKDITQTCNVHTFQHTSIRGSLTLNRANRWSRQELVCLVWGTNGADIHK